MICFIHSLDRKIYPALTKEALNMRLHDYLEYYAGIQPDKVFSEYISSAGKEVITYAEANQRANKMAHALMASGLEREDRMAYLSRNSTDMVLMYFASAKAGIVPVPLNYRLAPKEWLYIINDAEAKMLISDIEYVDSIQSIHNELQHTRGFVSLNGSAENWQEHEAWLVEHGSANLDLSISENDQLYQMYTSGTTGLPKGAMISHRAIDANLGQIARVFDLQQGAERMLVVAPLYHAGAGVLSMAGISMGATLIIHQDFDPVATVSSIVDDAITVAGLVPAMIQACLVGVPNIESWKFPSLKRMLYGASPIAAETLREAIEIFQCDFVQVFGMTETSALATALMPEDHRRALNGEPQLLLSAGKPAVGTRVKIVDENDNEVARNTIGELAIFGPQLMTGYWHLEEASAKSLKDGWMHTGDAATMDEEGFIFIQDRIKDMIVSGGENVYPREVENALFEHPGIADAAVIGIPSEKWGEAILGVIVVKDGHDLSSDELIEFCRERLAGYKVPRHFDFTEELPRNASGKVLKKDLREPYWEGIDRRVS